ncbi:unnamed protein product [Euphydryas editha]|uniref:Ig-like domain-containing protein n=1 Tax=Euphydryas editha TaxID=104508 RepID=A0AAU9TW95_EUPED|nr:unnamed protein product [Euphydryas editha]
MHTYVCDLIYEGTEGTILPLETVTEEPLIGIPPLPVNDTGNIFIQYLTHPPEITIRPRNLQVRANGIAAFYCAARGDPIPNIQWRKNGKKVSNTQSRFQVSGMDSAAGPNANGAVLRIDPVRAQRDDATYECIAENGVGDAVTAVATLTIFEDDQFKFLNFVAKTNYVKRKLEAGKWFSVR